VRHIPIDHDRLLEAPFAAELAHSIENQIEECLAARASGGSEYSHPIDQ
jgi:hypothetical protein